MGKLRTQVEQAPQTTPVSPTHEHLGPVSPKLAGPSRTSGAAADITPKIGRSASTMLVHRNMYHGNDQARISLHLQRRIGNLRTGSLLGRRPFGSEAGEQTASSVPESGRAQTPHISMGTVGQTSQTMVQRMPNPPGGPTCTSISVRRAPDPATLRGILVDKGILQARGRSTDFSNILYRHVDAGDRIGNAYIEYLRNNAYPMADFCIEYGGRGWNMTFRDILSAYGYSTPAHRDMQIVAATVLTHDRTNLLIYDENEMFPGGIRDPFASPLTPQRLQRKRQGTVLAGAAPEGALLLRSTDAYLSTLSISAATVAGTTPAATASGATTDFDIFQWGTAVTEGSTGDPNRFDAHIVHWTRHFNEIFNPLDRRGNPNPLDPDLVKAMIYVESHFSETSASSRSSARGLTQVLSRERRLVGEMPAGVSGVTDVNFSNPGVQIAVGIRILFEKYRRSRDWPTAIRDYNGSDRRDAYRARVLSVYRSHRRTPPAAGGETAE